MTKNAAAARMAVVLTLKTRVVRIGSLAAAPMGSGLGLADTETGRRYALDEVGNEIWRNLERAVTIDEICARLVEVFDAPRKRCEPEVLQFLAVLAEKGLVRVVE
jgi:hypothetical protein